MGKIYCTECGTELDETVKFCSSCGAPIDKKDETNEVTDNNNSSNENSVVTKEKPKKSIKGKYIAVGGILAIIILILLSFFILTVSSPLYSAEYTVDTSDYSVSSDKSSYPSFDNEFTGSNVNFYDNEGNGIDIWHHNAHGKDVDYYLKQYSTYDKDTSGNPAWGYYGVDYGVKVKNTDDITVDGEKGYIMDGTWGTGYENTWVILVHDDEYYLICFDGSINQEHQDKFLNSFQFKDN